MSELYTDLPLPEDARKLIEEPLTPFDQLIPDDPVNNLYELNERPIEGGNKMVRQYLKVGGEVLLLTRVEGEGGISLVEDIETPKDKVHDRLHHTPVFLSADEAARVFDPQHAAAA
jgi:hypothetical protein